MSGTASWMDLYRLDELLGEEERLVRATVRSFVEKEARPLIASHWEAGSFPTELIRSMGALGLFGPTLKGCSQTVLSNMAYGLMMLELEKADSGLRSFASVQGGLVMYPICRFGSEVQKERWLGPLAHGEKVGCFGLTEPDSGSDPGGMKTWAKRDGDGWILHGNKMWITNGTLADVAIVWARTEDGIRGFLVEKGTPGFGVTTMKGKMSLRASDTAELHLDEVRLGADALLPGSEGLGSALSCLNQARYSIAWGAVGAAMACLEEAVAYTQERQAFGGPLSRYQLLQAKFADMLSEIIKARLLVQRLAELKEEERVEPAMVSLAKRNNSMMALEVARSCRQILGANGISLEYQAGRHLCNLETLVTYEGTHEVHTLILGQAITGKAAFR